MECPYCLTNLELNGQKQLMCPECRSEIFLDKDNYIERAIRKNGRTPKSTLFIWFAFIFLGAALIIFGESINSNFFPMIYFLFVGILFANLFILGCKYKEIAIGGLNISEVSNPDRFLVAVLMVAILSIICLVLGIIEIFKLDFF
jgi:hypothetical protein